MVYKFFASLWKYLNRNHLIFSFQSTSQNIIVFLKLTWDMQMHFIRTDQCRIRQIPFCRFDYNFLLWNVKPSYTNSLVSSRLPVFSRLLFCTSLLCDTTDLFTCKKLIFTSQPKWNQIQCNLTNFDLKLD